jgi:hypothetical protein
MRRLIAWINDHVKRGEEVTIQFRGEELHAVDSRESPRANAVTPAKAGVQEIPKNWIPASAGMTDRSLLPTGASPVIE